MGPSVRWSLAAGAAVTCLPGVAAAGEWYYNWSCTGECAPGQLAISGREGPFPTREDCDYARDHDPRAQEFVRQGNLGGLDFCSEQTSPGLPGVRAPASPAGGGAGGQPAPQVRMAAIEVGVAAGPGWTATDEASMTTRGAATLGVELDLHTGRDLGGGSLQLGVHGTRLEAAALGGEPRTLVVLPFMIGLVLTPRLVGGDGWSVRADLGASIGGLVKAGCGECVGAVFDETLTFGYTLKAGLDVYLSKDSGVSVDVIFPRWPMGSATAGSLLLEPPAWLLRVALVGRPAPPP